MFSKKIILDGPAILKINNDNFTSNETKEIVMFDYIGDKKNDLLNGALTKNFNLKDYVNQNILSLKKFNNVNIKNLNHLKELIEKKNNEKRFHLILEYNYKKFLKLEI